MVTDSFGRDSVAALAYFDSYVSSSDRHAALILGFRTLGRGGGGEEVGSKPRSIN